MLVYLPALSGDVFRNDGWTTRPLNWMDPRLKWSQAYHPMGLAAFPAWRRQPFQWERGDWIFGDCGGFSIATRGLRIDPVAVMKWQTRFTDFGPILDTPYDGGKKTPDFNTCLRKTVEATRAALPVYIAAREAGTRFRWWGVVHGCTREELEAWYAAISNVYPFTEFMEGWAFKPRPENSPEGVAGILAFAGDHGIKRVHLFATTGSLALETAALLGPRNGIELLTVDSMSPRHQASWRQVRVPRREALKGPAGIEYMVETCACTSCELLREDLGDQQGLRDDPVYTRHRITFHNVLDVLAEVGRIRDQYGAPTAA